MSEPQDDFEKLSEYESWCAILADVVNTCLRENGGHFAQTKSWHPRDIKKAVDELIYALKRRTERSKVDGRVEGAEAGFDAGADAAEELRGLYDHEHREYATRLCKRREEFIESAKEDR